ncbi:hypothetical protein AGLY_018259 [Aphis glycines]|uniref:CCHC-type domain-containing protein n=1 Tax=Aphis glycines TaxID=307491 RepID=A0A6G0STC0_APHGL|nr:hypothetical protein AGLY_018259 [Aphis glycines]
MRRPPISSRPPLAWAKLESVREDGFLTPSPYNHHVRERELCVPVPPHPGTPARSSGPSALEVVVGFRPVWCLPSEDDRFAGVKYGVAHFSARYVAPSRQRGRDARVGASQNLPPAERCPSHSRDGGAQLCSQVGEGCLDSGGDSGRPEPRASFLPERVRSIGRDLDKLLLAEKEKKKLSAAVHKAILEIRGRYEEILDEVSHQNVILEGRLEEARAGHVCEASERRRVKTTKENPVPPSQEVVITKPPKAAATKKPPKKKPVEGPVPPSKDKGQFTVVVSKKKKRKKKKKGCNGAAVPGVPVAPEKTAKAMERVKARAPARAFIVSAEGASAGEARKKLWADLVKEVGAPRISRAANLPRGDILVKPADEGTYKALKDMEAAGKTVREEKARWPTVLIYDVDRDVESSKLSGMIMEQNPELGLEKESVVPLFMKGSKAEEQVWWGCSVRPSHFRTVVGKSLYIGMSRCRVKEYVDIVRCFKCQRFGHRAAMCQAKVDTCGRCAVQGHRARDCQGGPVKCANCGLKFQSGHSDCVAMVKATFMVARRTDFGPK